MDLYEFLGAPVLAHRLLHSRLHLEDQTPIGAAQVEITPVDALVQGRLRRDRQFGLGRRIDAQRGKLDLEATELHALVGHHKAGDRDRRLGRERGDRLVELARLLLLAEDQLGKTCFVAQHHELHALLIADGVHPPAELDGLLHV